ncbi:MAG: alanyl-tRNA editing protein [Candidatus Heimdallarchaeota archaeon]|nr:alanyl-tRNA editing protein [Candidatus Heimdallarchaeota archaeon]
MPEELYLNNMNLKKFEAKVVSVTDGKFIILNQTVFYPKSGGVANDEGVLKKDSEIYNVVYVGKFGGKVSHEVDKTGLCVGDKVIGELDWIRRFKLMRYHTAVHVVSGIFYKNLGVKITGGDISIDQGRVDFNLEHFDRNEIEKQIKECNDIIQKDYPVEVYYMDRAEVEIDPDLTKLAKGFPKNIKTVRIVDIKGFDRQPDGGCHVSSLKEIGKIQISKLINKGKNNRRLYITLE